MALMPIAPWIVPPSPMEALQAGSRIGLAARQEDVAETQAGDRLRLAYDQLQSQERRATEALKAHMAQQNAAMQLRAQQQQSLDTYRQGMLQSAAERLRMAEERASRALQTSDLTTTTKDGETYMMRDGKWFHVPSSKQTFDTVTEEVPAVEGSPGSPETPSRLFGLIGGSPAVPPVPGHPAYRRTRHVPVGADPFAPPAEEKPFFNVVPGTAGDELRGQTTTGSSGETPSFDSEEEALASGVKGIVLINGRRARID